VPTIRASGPAPLSRPSTVESGVIRAEAPRVRREVAESHVQAAAEYEQELTADRKDQLRRLAATGEPVRELAAAFGIGRATAYRYLASQ
jgi:DNA invertase Pin-like site-specific DNA recombinase